MGVMWLANRSEQAKAKAEEEVSIIDLAPPTVQVGTMQAQAKAEWEGIGY